MPSLAKLEKDIGYTFQDQSLLTQAVTHRSFSDVNNERLEFLGDSILNFAIAAELYRRLPDASEGELTRLRAGYVKRGTLADVARELKLGELLIMGSGEMKSGGFKRDSILSDALEAILGAIIIDSDHQTAVASVQHLFRERLANVSTEHLKKDAKSRLQEHLQGSGQSVPEYKLLRSTGKSPDQTFEVECRSDSLPEKAVAIGTSIRRAEQQAAEIALKQLGLAE